ncbi:hypothetical protein [Halomonas sp.]|uniref:hypothetical protein n=1 Tax=Halomonas sp. TaxID=1486246 RepID=UPI00384D20E1
MGGTTHGQNRRAPEEVESLREEMRQAEKRLAILAAPSSAVHRLKAALRRDDYPEDNSDAPPGLRGR